MCAARRKESRRAHALRNGYRSGLEEQVALQLGHAGVLYAFEPCRVEYVIPAKVHRYTPDFILRNGIIVETKGRFLPKDRQKHILLKEQYPRMELRFVFSNPYTKINKTSSTTYADWCEKNGFIYAKQEVPLEWLKEGPFWTPFNLKEMLKR